MTTKVIVGGGKIRYMDISREYGDRLAAYHDNKQVVPIGIFGSFHRYALLETLRDHLIASGYNAYLSTDFMARIPKAEGEDIDVYNFRVSRELIDRSGICIFIVFSERHGETNTNQSVSQEAQYLYDMQVSGLKGDDPRVLVLVEDGSKPASLFRGLVKSCYPRWNEAPFSSREDLLMAARQFCWNVMGG